MQGKNRCGQQTGSWGEQLAADYLAEQGFVVIDRNYRTGLGEIDVIARRDRTVYFFEVKARGRGSLIAPFEAITPAKMRRMRRVAEHYLLRHPRAEGMPCRFGVIGIDYRVMPPEIECVLDAFA